MSDIENIKKLRVATGAGFKDCNLAIKESNGDIDKAIDVYKKAININPNKTNPINVPTIPKAGA